MTRMSTFHSSRESYCFNALSGKVKVTTAVMMVQQHLFLITGMCTPVSTSVVTEVRVGEECGMIVE